MNMTRMTLAIHVHFGQQVPDYMKVFSFKAKGTFSTPKNYHRLVT